MYTYMNFSKFYTYLCSYESILVILLIFLTIGNIILLSKTPSYLLLVNLLLLLGYFLLSKRNDKMIILKYLKKYITKLKVILIPLLECSEMLTDLEIQKL